MENANQAEVRQWVSRQTAYLDPPDGWTPDPAAALTRFRARRTETRRWLWASWAAAVLLLPVGFVAAQQLWQSLTVRQVAFIRVNSWPHGVPSPPVKLQGMLIPPIPARSADDARSRVGYVPRLPHPGVLNGSPRLSTTFSLAAGTVIKVADLELALRKAEISGVTVPRQWDGAHLTLHTSGIVIAEWPDILLAQSLPLTLTAPPDFDFPAFSALILRVLGVGPDEALRLAQRAGTVPPWLAPIDRELEARATIEEVELNSGPATLVQKTGDVPRTTLVWSVADRVYVLDGKLERQLAIAVGNAVQ